MPRGLSSSSSSLSRRLSNSNPIPMLFLIGLVVLYFLSATFTQAIAHASASCALLSHDHTFLLSCAAIAVGAVVSGWLSDKIGDRGLLLQLLLALGLAATLASSVVHQSDSLILLGIATLAGLLCGGSHVVIAFALELSQQQQLSTSKQKNSLKRVLVFSAFPLSILPVSLALEIVQNVSNAFSLVVGLALMGVTSLAIFIARTAAAKHREVQESSTAAAAAASGADEHGGHHALPLLFPDEIDHAPAALFDGHSEEEEEGEEEDDHDRDHDHDHEGTAVAAAAAHTAASSHSGDDHHHHHHHQYGHHPRQHQQLAGVSSLGNNLTGLALAAATSGGSSASGHAAHAPNKQRRDKPSQRSIAKGTALVRTRDHKKFGGSSSSSSSSSAGRVTAAAATSNAAAVGSEAGDENFLSENVRIRIPPAAGGRRGEAMGTGTGGATAGAPGDAQEPYCPSCFPFLLTAFQRRCLLSSGSAMAASGGTVAFFTPLPTSESESEGPAPASPPTIPPVLLSSSSSAQDARCCCCLSSSSSVAHQLGALMKPLPFDNNADEEPRRRSRRGSKSAAVNASARGSPSGAGSPEQQQHGNNGGRSPHREDGAHSATTTTGRYFLGSRAMSRIVSSQNTAIWLVLAVGLLALARALLTLNFWVSPVEPLLNDDSACSWRFPPPGGAGKNAPVPSPLAAALEEEGEGGGSSVEAAAAAAASSQPRASIGLHIVVADTAAVVLAAYLCIKIGRLKAASTLALASLSMALICSFVLPSLVSDDVADLFSSSALDHAAATTIPIGRSVLESLTHGLITASMQSILLYAIEFAPSTHRGTVLGAAIGAFRTASLFSAVIVMMMASSSSSPSSSSPSSGDGDSSSTAPALAPALAPEAHLAWTDYALQAPGGVGGLLVLIGFSKQANEGAETFAAAASGLSLFLACLFLFGATVSIYRMPIETKGKSLRTYAHGQLKAEKGAPPPLAGASAEELLFLAGGGAVSSSLLSSGGRGGTLRGRGNNNNNSARSNRSGMVPGSHEAGASGAPDLEDGDGDTSFGGCLRWIHFQTSASSSAAAGAVLSATAASGGRRVRGGARDNDEDENGIQADDEDSVVMRRGASGANSKKNPASSSGLSSWFGRFTDSSRKRTTNEGHELVPMDDNSGTSAGDGRKNEDDEEDEQDGTALVDAAAWHIDQTADHATTKKGRKQQKQQRYDYSYSTSAANANASATSKPEEDDGWDSQTSPVGGAGSTVAVTVNDSPAFSGPPATTIADASSSSLLSAFPAEEPIANSANPEADAELGRLVMMLQRLEKEWEGNHKQKLADALDPSSLAVSSANNVAVSSSSLDQARLFMQRAAGSLAESRALLRSSRRALQLHEAASDERYSRAFAHLLLAQGGRTGGNGGPIIDEGAKERVDRVESLVAALQSLKTRAEEAILAVSLQLKVRKAGL